MVFFAHKTKMIALNMQRITPASLSAELTSGMGSLDAVEINVWFEMNVIDMSST